MVSANSSTSCSPPTPRPGRRKGLRGMTQATGRSARGSASCSASNQPLLVQLRKDRPGAFRVVGELSGADRIMKEALFVGTYPGLTREMLDYIVETVHAYVKRH